MNFHSKVYRFGVHPTMIASADPALAIDHVRIIRRDNVDILRLSATRIRHSLYLLEGFVVDHVKLATRLLAGVAQVNDSPLLQLMDEPYSHQQISGSATGVVVVSS